MFVNLETTVLQELVNAEADSKWNQVVARLLASYERNVAVGKIANAIQWDIYERECPLDPLVADLYMHALKRVDFYTIALELIKGAEALGCRALDHVAPMAA
jgi:hypothetical protein